MKNTGSDTEVISKNNVHSQKLRKEEVCELAQDPYLVAHILKDLERDVKRDILSKLSSLFTHQSAYISEPLVTALKGPSGVGKTHNVIKASKYFPKEDVLLLGGLSPKSLIHEHGVLMDPNNKLILPEDKPTKPKRRLFPSGDRGTEEYDQALENYRRELILWNERNQNSYKLIRLQNKILIFLEAPPQETTRMLLPILSHDTRRIEYRYVEELETKTAIIEGWPAVVFLSAGTPYMEELSTRTLTVTPESGADKIEEANKLTNVQAAYPWEYEEEKKSTKIIQEIILRIKDKMTAKNFGVAVPFANLYEMFPKEIIRDMRDFKHFVQFLKALTSVHIFQRPILKVGEKFHVLASIDDVVMALSIYCKIFETTRTGTEENVLKFYHELVKTQENWLKKDLVTEYNKRHKKKVSGDTIGWWLRRLSVIGYVNITKSTLDKRVNLYEPLVKEEEKHEIVRVLEDREGLRSKLEKGFENWLEKNVEKKEFYKYEISDDNMVLKEIDLDTVKDSIKKFSFKNIPSDFHSIYAELSLLKPEKQPENIREVENRTFSDNLKKEDWKDRCPICGSYIRQGQERVRLAPWRDGIDAHKACIERIDMHFMGGRYYHKDKTWREYVRELQRTKEINKEVERDYQEELDREVARRRRNRDCVREREKDKDETEESDEENENHLDDEPLNLVDWLVRNI